MNFDTSHAAHLAVLGSGLFFMTGLLTGVWKYRSIITSADAKAPVYVDICHRAALMYSFACLVLAEFARLSTWSPEVNVFAVGVSILFFALAVVTYAVHGVLRDTDNQLERPHRLGRFRIHPLAVSIFMYALIAGELGGFLILFSGSITSLSL